MMDRPHIPLHDLISMSQVARMLITEPSTYIPAMVDALRKVKGQGPAAVVVQHIYEQVNK